MVKIGYDNISYGGINEGENNILKVIQDQDHKQIYLRKLNFSKLLSLYSCFTC